MAPPATTLADESSSRVGAGAPPRPCRGGPQAIVIFCISFRSFVHAATLALARIADEGGEALFLQANVASPNGD